MRYAVQYSEEGIARCKLQNSKEEALKLIRYYKNFNIVEQYSTIDTVKILTFSRHQIRDYGEGF